MVHKYVDTFQTNMPLRGTFFVTWQSTIGENAARGAERVPHPLPTAHTAKTGGSQ